MYDRIFNINIILIVCMFTVITCLSLIVGWRWQIIIILFSLIKYNSKYNSLYLLLHTHSVCGILGGIVSIFDWLRSILNMYTYIIDIYILINIRSVN